jgi:hypothetical protein
MTPLDTLLRLMASSIDWRSRVVHARSEPERKAFAAASDYYRARADEVAQSMFISGEWTELSDLFAGVFLEQLDADTTPAATPAN